MPDRHAGRNGAGECGRTRRPLPALLGGNLPTAAAERLRGHLAECRACRAEWEAYRGDARTLRQFLQTAPWSPIAEQVLSRTERAQGAGRRWLALGAGAPRLATACAALLLLLVTAGILALVAPGVLHRGVALPAGTGDPAAAQLLLVDQAPAPAGSVVGAMAPLRLRPIEPASLADLPERASIDLGHHFVHAVSPDGRTMAVVVWPVAGGGGGVGGVLHLIDLATWTATTPGLTVDDNIGGIAFDPDGEDLYWFAPTRIDQAHGMPRDFHLFSYDLASRAISSVVGLPTSYMPWEGEPRFVPATGRLAVWVVPTDAGNLAEDAPHLLLIDPGAGRIAADLRLDGIRAGQFRTPGGEYEILRPGLAWDLPRARLYVAHADEERVTVVDLAKGAIVARADIRPRASLADRIASWLVPAAAAKDNPMTQRLALLSPDGTRLYLLGTRTEVDAQWRGRLTSTGLQVITTRDLREIHRFVDPGGEVTDVALSPNGRWLVLRAIAEADAGGGVPVAGATQRLLILDADRLAEVAALSATTPFLQGFSPDGRLAYFSRPGTIGDAGARDWSVAAVDLDTGRVVAERRLDGFFPGQFILARADHPQTTR